MPGNASTFFGIGSGGKPLVLVGRRIFKASGTVIIPAGCKYDIFALGAAGSGASVVAADGRASGGGGPGWSRDWGEVATDTTVTVTLGTGGAATSPASVAQNGNDGGTTTVVGTGINISITGGKKGLASATIANVNGGDGGVATGGKFNVPGGRGGNISNSGTGQKATGGGAANLFATATANATRGGDITGTTVGNQATGGGGVGGRGGDNPTGNSITTGGGAGGDAADGTSTGPGPDVIGGIATNTQPATNFVLDILATYPGVMPTSSGNASASATLEGGGVAGTTSSSSGVAAFGGGGGVAYGGGNGAGSATTRGGGSGGCACQGGTTANSGKGADAMVVVSIYKEQA